MPFQQVVRETPQPHISQLIQMHLYKEELRSTWPVCVKIPTYAQFMFEGSPLCPRICNVLDIYKARKALPRNKSSGPILGLPISKAMSFTPHYSLHLPPQPYEKLKVNKFGIQG